ncbi:hypothetical protein [Pantoea cypripedii]|uniref:Secreted protein n=1 Tax=Pantoea cypripedii TaxID=55209 RepID=A0A6B9G9G4_PANCY|nr:hypothetical protein [Pantoea cypripedii]QGY32503.1 hypothetical protein CUN67_26425 [Pantoea cypripedii]
MYKMNKMLYASLLIAIWIAPARLLATDAPPSVNSSGGKCSPTLVNSNGNTIILTCSFMQNNQDDKFKVVLGYTARTPILDGQIDWRFVDTNNSDITIYVDNKQKVYENLNTQFTDEILTLRRGQHIFRIEISFTYFRLPNGYLPDPSDADCTIVLDVQAAGKVFPKFNLRQMPDGKLLPIDCSFTI